MYNAKFKPSKYFTEHSFLSQKAEEQGHATGQAQQERHPQPDF